MKTNSNFPLLSKISYRFIAYSIILLIIVCTGIAFALANNNFLIKRQLYKGDPAFDKLSPAVKQSQIFQPAPVRKAQQLDLASLDIASNTKYSHYKILPQTTQDGRSLYHTVETIYDGSGFQGISPSEAVVVQGQGISFGGIFWPLEKMTMNDPHSGKQLYYNKIAIIDIQAVKGKLFPLQIGNKLSFNFTRLHKRIFNDKKTFTIEHGTMTYKVIKEQKEYHLKNGHNIPGNIFTINVSETTDLHPKSYLTDQYDYSPMLGWYINDRYFDTDNRFIANYQLQQWKSNG